MIIKEKHDPFYALVLISAPKLATRAAELLMKSGVLISYKCHAVGTAPSEVIDLLGLGNPDKVVQVSCLSQRFADDIMKKLKKGLKLGSANTGIAFLLPLTGASRMVVNILLRADERLPDAERKERGMADTKYSLITAVVNQGYSENVMEAARSAGAGGGTVIHSRRVANDEEIGALGLGIQSEKDMVFIVAEEGDKSAIMQAIGEKCGVKTEAGGIVVSLPIDSVAGI